MPHKSHTYGLILLSLVSLLATTSCSKDDDINLNPRMIEANLPDEIPFSELGSGKLLFTRGYTPYLIDIDNRSVNELVIDPVGGAVLSPDGRTISFVSIEEVLHLWNIVENNHIKRPFNKVDFNLISWSPDSQKLYYSIVYTNKLYTLDVGDNSYTRTFIREFPLDILYLSPFSISARGDLAIYVSASFFTTESQDSLEFVYDGLYTMNPEGRESKCISKYEGDRTLYSHCSPKWSPDGQTIAYLSITNHKSSSTQEIILIDKDGSNARTIVKKEIPSANVPFEGWGVLQINISLCWSPDGARIAFIGMEGDIESHIYIVDIQTKELIQVTSEEGIDDRYISWSN